MRPLLASLLFFGTAAERAVVFVRHPEGAADRLLHELSLRADPSSKLYLQWLSKDEVASILSPDPAHLAVLDELARRHVATATTVVGGDKLVVDFGTAAVPPSFLEAAVASGAADGSARSSFRLARPPPVPRRRGSNATTSTDAWPGPQSCLSSLDGVTPTCLRKAYGLDSHATIGGGGGGGGGGQAFAVDNPFKPADLAQFQKEYGLPDQPVAHVVGQNSGAAGHEASLDAQWLIATGEGVETTFVYLDGKADNPFTNWLVWAAGAPDATLPKVHSLSVGAPEDAVGDAIIGRMNTEMAALGARGVSVVFASGDSGWQPQQKFGAASPYVTAVGGIYNGEMRSGALQADALTTGGFAASAHNKAGAWQKGAIASYMATHGRRPKKIDPNQRAVPDVSAYDDEINVVINGGDTTLSGTSAACPMVAGMLASINTALAAAGHNTTLGFANPFLYANEAAFLDITRGDNNGIAAVKGYDPISGLGTFGPTTFQQLKAAAVDAAAAAARKRQVVEA